LALSAAAAGGYLLAETPAGCGRGCMGYVYLPAAGLIGVAAILAAPWGVRAARSLPVPALRRALGIVMLAIVVNLARSTPIAAGAAALAQALFAKPEGGVTIVAKTDRGHPKPWREPAVSIVEKSDRRRPKPVAAARIVSAGKRAQPDHSGPRSLGR
jgi:hypothetical protein